MGAGHSATTGDSKGRCVVDSHHSGQVSSRENISREKVVIGHVLLESVHGDSTDWFVYNK